MPPKKKGAAPAPIFAAADDGDLEALLEWCARAAPVRCDFVS